MNCFLTTNIVGGLGNQLFLIANLLATSQRTGIPAALEYCEWSSSSTAPRPVYWESIFKNLPELGVSDIRTIGSSSRLHDVVVPECRPVSPILLDSTRRDALYRMVGFFQSATFFADAEATVQQMVPNDLKQIARKHLNAAYGFDGVDTDNCTAEPIVSHTSPGAHFIAMHVRRGDYLEVRDVFEILEAGYYDRALRQLCGGLLLDRSSSVWERTRPVRDLHVLIFAEESEDRYVRTLEGYLRTKYDGVTVSWVHPSNEEKATTYNEATAAMPREVLELLMMASCSDVVMANSTFSWWGAYLNRSPLRRVIAPSKWFVKDPFPHSNHLYCENWMLL